ncbi:unnamed protein product [Cyprideis torosa]|uniref:Uncharacterized protein n=1 Tax=Cyprideis torosa TaxID=163714 RepID=A0A7R8WPS4_9CRUS|nr:unnamed protein product [Cyprideis torosa]CAG0902176.1 unnamed protein product [Cyprideis torosa]
MQPTLTFSKHLRRRKAIAIAAIGSLKHLQKVSIKTAMKIFKLKIKPIYLYGWDSISPYLSSRHLQESDRIKTIFLKKALGLPKNSSGTLSTKLCDTQHFVQELESNFEFNPEALRQYKEQLRNRLQRFQEQDFQRGPAFATDEWKEANRRYRHIYTRATAHGFHHMLCKGGGGFHGPSDACSCRVFGFFLGGLRVEDQDREVFLERSKWTGLSSIHRTCRVPGFATDRHNPAEWWASEQHIRLWCDDTWLQDNDS